MELSDGQDSDHPHEAATRPLPEQRGGILPSEVCGQRLEELPRRLGEGAKFFHTGMLKPVPLSLAVTPLESGLSLWPTFRKRQFFSCGRVPQVWTVPRGGLKQDT